MNLQRFQELTDHYIDSFELTNSKPHTEYYKWEFAKKFRPAMDEALAASDEELPQKLYNVKKLTANVIDSYTQPFNGLVNFAKKEPVTIRNMFKELFAINEADIKKKEKTIFSFLDKSLSLREKYYPDSYLYRDDLHSITGYMFLYDPDHNYMYKASHCRIFADCIEFYDDWGSGSDTKLDIFSRMCDECIEAINNTQALLRTAESRYEIDREGMHPDTKKHILLFDMIYCCSTYNLFKGIHIVTPKSKDRQLMQERKEKALELKQNLDEARQKAIELETFESVLSEAIIVGENVNHKTFGKGKISSVNEGKIIIDFENAGTKELGINLSLANKLLTIENLNLTDNQMALLKEESKIRSAITYAEKAAAPYMEYLD